MSLCTLLVVVCIVCSSFQFTVDCRRELKESQQKLAELKEETSHVMDTELPSLLDELAALQATPVLRGDYQLKLARQNYFTSKQDKVVKAGHSCFASC